MMSEMLRFLEWLVEQLFDVMNSVFFRVTHIEENYRFLFIL